MVGRDKLCQHNVQKWSQSILMWSSTKVGGVCLCEVKWVWFSTAGADDCSDTLYPKGKNVVKNQPHVTCGPVKTTKQGRMKSQIYPTTKNHGKERVKTTLHLLHIIVSGTDVESSLQVFLHHFSVVGWCSVMKNMDPLKMNPPLVLQGFCRSHTSTGSNWGCIPTSFFRVMKDM